MLGTGPAQGAFGALYEESKQGNETAGLNFMMPNVGQNDKYLISKLRSYSISVDKIDAYMAKLNSENVGISGGGA